MPKFYEIKKIRSQGGGNIGRIDLYGDIDRKQFWGNEITPNTFAAELGALGPVSEIEIHVFSSGGDMFASCCIYDILRSRPEKKIGYVEGVAASGGSVIICGCDFVYMSPASMLFVHCALNNPGYVNEHSAKILMEELIKFKEPMTAAYMKKSGRTREEVSALMDGVDGFGTWLTAAEAIEFRLADALTPEAKLPLEAVAMLSPGVYNYRGCRVDLTMFDKAGDKTAGIINSKRGGSPMAWWNKKEKPAASIPAKPKAEITFVEMVCPSCGGAVAMNPETGEIFPGAKNSQTQPGNEAGAAPAPTASLARLMPGNVKAAIFTVPCPHCGESFVWDTDANVDGKEGEQTKEAVPLGSGENNGGTNGSAPAKPAAPAQAPGQSAPAPASAPAAAKTPTKPKAELAQSICPACGAAFNFDTAQAQTGTDSAGTQGYMLTCPQCATQYVEPLAAAEPTAIPVGTNAQAAYQMGVRAERERVIALAEMALAAPGVENMIAAAVKSGASVLTMSRNVFKALAKNPNIKAAPYVQAINRDVEASGVNTLLMPQHHDKQASFADSVFESLNNR